MSSEYHPELTRVAARSEAEIRQIGELRTWIGAVETLVSGQHSNPEPTTEDVARAIARVQYALCEPTQPGRPNDIQAMLPGMADRAKGYWYAGRFRRDLEKACQTGDGLLLDVLLASTSLIEDTNELLDMYHVPHNTRLQEAVQRERPGGTARGIGRLALRMRGSSAGRFLMVSVFGPQGPFGVPPEA